MALVVAWVLGRAVFRTWPKESGHGITAGCGDSGLTPLRPLTGGSPAQAAERLPRVRAPPPVLALHLVASLINQGTEIPALS